MKYEKRSIEIKIPERAFKKLDKYGFDYAKNIEGMLFMVYSDIVVSEAKEIGLVKEEEED